MPAKTKTKPKKRRAAPRKKPVIDPHHVQVGKLNGAPLILDMRTISRATFSTSMSRDGKFCHVSAKLPATRVELASKADGAEALRRWTLLSFGTLASLLMMYGEEGVVIMNRITQMLTQQGFVQPGDIGQAQLIQAPQAAQDKPN